ncbi:hypothetical protein Ppb6_03978 [Photorhabdus australis subsp. thailandensis]|uniref:Uncharacterized protein n=1 Tax=Photorhabdus australis subsp. thailandensis TaxID=2805096 RepID=A0A1C0TYY1_9GAMM|nr:hypothetical protein Ppb6_03978 [Photorhabdus australis subsp. thailandensis]
MFSAGRPAFTAGHAGGREAVCAQGRAQSAFHLSHAINREPANFRTVQPRCGFRPALGCPACHYLSAYRLAALPALTAVLPGASAHALSLSG